MRIVRIQRNFEPETQGQGLSATGGGDDRFWRDRIHYPSLRPYPPAQISPLPEQYG